MLLLEAVLVAVAQLDHRLHVDFVERRQDRRGRLRLHQPLGDALAQPRHRHALLGPAARARRQRAPARRGRRLVLPAPGPAELPASRLRLDGGEHVALGDAAAAAGAAARRPASMPCFGHQLARGRQRGRLRAPALRRCGRRCRAAAARRRRGAAGAAAGAEPRRAASPRPCRRCRSPRSLPAPATVDAVALADLRRARPTRGAGSSSTTLSVSMSIRFSSRLTASPAFLCQLTSVASATDSGSCGTLTSIEHASDFAPVSVAGDHLARRELGRERVRDQLLLLRDVLRHVADRGRRRDRAAGVGEHLFVAAMSARR